MVFQTAYEGEIWCLFIVTFLGFWERAGQTPINMQENKRAGGFFSQKQ